MTNPTVTQSRPSFTGLLEELFGLLSVREKDVLERRHSLKRGSQKKETLEKIGQDYKITRERVRQIERDGIKKLGEKYAQSGIKDHLAEIEKNIVKFLKKYGGVMREETLLNNLVDFYGISTQGLGEEELWQHKKSLAFIISQLLIDRFEKVEGRGHFHDTWKLKEAPWDLVEDVIEKLVNLLSQRNKPIKTDELFKLIKEQNFYPEMTTKLRQLGNLEEGLTDLDEAIMSYLQTSKKIKSNLFGQVGLSHWNTITPKRMADKIYLVMKEAGRPLHFTEIAELINQTKFDHKKALPATIHNELILDDRYVLIGRGIYALKEWGYQAGTVAEVIAKILTAEGPLTKDQIVAAVGKQRIVKKATVNLALMNKNKFQKLPDKKYGIV